MHHFPIQQNLPLTEEASQLQGEVGQTETEKQNDVSDCKAKEQASEDCEASSATETMAEDESKASKDAEHAIDGDPSDQKVFFYRFICSSIAIVTSAAAK